MDIDKYMKNITKLQAELSKTFNKKCKLDKTSAGVILTLGDRSVRAEYGYSVEVIFEEKNIDWITYTTNINNTTAYTNLIKLWLLEHANSPQLELICPSLSISKERKKIEHSISSYTKHRWETGIEILNYQEKTFKPFLDFIVEKKQLTNVLPFVHVGTLSFGKFVNERKKYGILVWVNEKGLIIIEINNKIIFSSENLKKAYDYLLGLFPKEVIEAKECIVEY